MEVGVEKGGQREQSRMSDEEAGYMRPATGVYGRTTASCVFALRHRRYQFKFPGITIRAGVSKACDAGVIFGQERVRLTLCGHQLSLNAARLISVSSVLGLTFSFSSP